METSNTDNIFKVFSNGFRGSPNGWAPIEKINFLIGENSSGKSSFLKLLRIIVSPSFQLRYDCYLESNNDFTISDYRSRLHRVRSYGAEHPIFTIGFIGNSETNDGENNLVGRLISYQSGEDGLRASRITELFPTSIRQITIENSYLIPKRSTFKESSTIETLQKSLVRKHFEKLPKTAPEIGKLEDSDKFDNGVLAGALRVNPFWEQLDKGTREEKTELSVPEIDFSRIPNFAADVDFIGPIRTASTRVIYSSSDQADVSGKTSLPKLAFLKKEAIKSITEFGKESGLFEAITIQDISGDFGKGAIRVNFVKGKKNFFADELGHGVGQIFPILVEIVRDRKNSIFIAEQPEVHLHPKAQAAFGTLIYKFGKLGHCAVIETHSDYIIDRFRYERLKDEGDALNSKILFFDNTNGSNKSYEIEIGEGGHLTDTPSSYRNFFLREEMKMLNFI